jgi:hypothetical protein
MHHFLHAFWRARKGTIKLLLLVVLVRIGILGAIYLSLLVDDEWRLAFLIFVLFPELLVAIPYFEERQWVTIIGLLFLVVSYGVAMIIEAKVRTGKR